MRIKYNTGCGIVDAYYTPGKRCVVFGKWEDRR